MSQLIKERLQIVDMMTGEKLRRHAEATRDVVGEREETGPAAAPRGRHGTTGGSFRRTVAQSGTEGTMPPSGEAEVFDAYLENLRDNEHDPVACRRRAVYSSVFDPLKAHLERPKSPRRSEPRP